VGVKTDRSAKRDGIFAIAAGVAFLLPLVFYFHFLPAAGSNPTHALHPESFLPWMAEKGSVRVALWWTACISFLIAFLAVPSALGRRLDRFSPAASRVAETAGWSGFFTLLVSGLMLAAGELPLARAYVGAAETARPAIVAVYVWQQLVTAVLFDVLGFFLIGVMLLAAGAAGWRSKRLPGALCKFSLFAALTSFAFAVGNGTRTGWLGETGFGMLAFLAVPAWMIWFGIFLTGEST
jgi:hypothetical protein